MKIPPPTTKPARCNRATVKARSLSTLAPAETARLLYNAIMHGLGFRESIAEASQKNTPVEAPAPPAPATTTPRVDAPNRAPKGGRHA